VEKKSNRQKVIVTCALTGGIHGKEANSNLPEQPDEIVTQGLAAAAAGAAVIHVHVRRPEDGKPTSDLSIFKHVLNELRQRTDAIIQLTTGGAPGTPIEERTGTITLKPESCSFNMGLLNWHIWGGEQLAINRRSELEQVATSLLEHDVKPELEVYGLEMLDDVEYLVNKGLLAKPYYINFVMNVPAQGAIKGTPENLLLLVQRAKGMFAAGDYLLNVSAAGIAQLPLTTIALAMGINARVGLEDNVRYAAGQLCTDNAQLVARTIRIARELNLEPATPDEAREMLGINKGS
jgi:3-keto-5-aminohexanoate cleavage enzyme